jgi:sugar phosphate isomerase/epimerase
MRFGAMNFPIRPIFDEIREFADLGFDYLELSLDPPEAHHDLIRGRRREIGRLLESRDMGLVIHLPTFVLTADLTDGIRRASVREMIAGLDLAAEMAAEKVVLHPSAISGLGPLVIDLARDLARKSLAEILAHAEKRGIRVCLENMFPRYRSFFEPGHFTEALDCYPNLEMTLDTGHANIDDAGRSRIFQFIRRFGDRIGHLHASDNGGSRDEHLAPGQGTIDFPAVVKALTAAGYRDTATMEIFSENRAELAAGRDRMRDLFQRAGKESG